MEVEALKQQLAAQVEQSEFLNTKHSEVSKSYKLLQQQFDAEVQERKLYKASFVELETQVIILRNRISDLEESMVRTCFRLQEPVTLDSQENTRLILTELEGLKEEVHSDSLDELTGVLSGKTEEGRVGPQKQFSFLSDLLPKLPARLFPHIQLAFRPLLLT